jgi:hypothetical protein
MRKSRTTAGPMGLLFVFYAAMAGLALYGQSDGLMVWMELDRVPALAVAAAVELLAAVLFAFADWRRVAFGEQAIAARLLSVSVALGVAVMNYRGHLGNAGQTALYTGASLAGYAVLVLHTEARRRDALRAAGRLPAQAPAYGLALWLRMPGTVWRARQLATADPSLGVYDSIAAAVSEKATAIRHKAIAAALRRKLTTSLDPISADIAMVSYDLDRVASLLAESVDYGRLTAILAADIDPARLSPASGIASADMGSDERPDSGATTRRVRPVASVPTQDLVAAMSARDPKLQPAAIAKAVGVTDRTVRRHLSKLAGQVSGEGADSRPFSAVVPDALAMG